MANYTSTHTGATIDASVTIVSGSGVTQSDLTKLNAVTSSAIELNILDGVTASTAEINILDGLTATTAELNYLDGADSSITTLSLPDNTTITTFGASLIDDADAATARTTLGVDVAGTDNSTDVTLVTTSHDYLSISGQAITLGSIDISDDTNLTGGTGITLTGDTLSTTDSEIVHDNLSGFVANEHIDHSTVSISAGSGLSGGGDLTSTRTLSIDSSVVTLSATQTLSNKSISGTANTISNVHIVDDTINTLTIARGGTGGTTSAEARSNLNVDVAGTDNSTDVTLVTTSHDYLSLSGQEITLGEIDISDDTNLVGGTGITLTGDTLSTTDSEIVHDNLSGFVSNEHIDHSTVSITAGTGLSGGGDITTSRTLTTDDSAIVHDNLSGFVANEHIDHSSVSITAGAGLTGGGDITATRDIAVGAGTGVTVNADDIAIGQDVATNADVTFNSVTADIIGDIRGATKFQAKADVALNKGDAVYISGVSGTTPTVDIADANDSAKMPSFGLAAESVSINASVEIITFGTLAGLNTSGFSVGDILFISTNGTSGNTLTATAPSGESSLIQNIGIVQRSHASAGSIKVGGAGRTNATPNLDDGDIFIGNGSNQAVSASLNTKIEDYLDGGTSTANFDTISVDGAEITATPAELNVLDGITSTTAELNYTDGVTSNIQTQLDAKAPLASPAFTGTATGANLTLSGDLTVNGSTTTLDTTNLAVEDNLMELNAGVTSNANDSGFLIERGTTGDNAIFMWDESADKFTLGTTTATGTTTGDITLSSTGTLVANVEGNVTGAVTGNADTATTLATARNFSLTGDVTAGAVSFDGSGNVALSTTIAANSVALGTDTTGNYMSDLTEGTGIDISHTPGEGSNGTITLDLTEVGFGGGANRLITDDGDGTVSTEANLTFDGNTLTTDALIIDGGGTYAAGSIYSDSNWGMLFRAKQASPSQAEFRWADSADSELMRIDSSGNVGIGTTSPGEKLDVNGTGYIRTAVFSDAFKPYSGTLATYGNNSSTDHYFVGDVGIGTASPGALLDVAGDGKIQNDLWISTDLGELQFGAGKDGRLYSYNDDLYIDNQTQDQDIHLRVNDGGVYTTALFIDGDTSRVGIGTSSPDGKLNIDVNTSAAAGQNDDASNYSFVLNCTSGSSTGHIERHIGFRDPGGDVVSAINAVDDGASGATGITFATGNVTTLSERMRINSSGNVGIGTSSPQSKLNINVAAESAIPSAGNDTTFLMIGNDGSGTTNYGTMIGTLNTGNGYIQQQRFDGTATTYNLLLQPNGGNVGIGTTTPGAKLHIKTPSSVNADLFVEATDFTPTLRMYSGGTNIQSLIRFGTGSGSSKLKLQSITAGGGISGSVSDVMTLQENGNVGIGTDSPATKLHIQDNYDPDDSLGYVQIENTNTTSGSVATNAALTTKNYHGTSQFMQWEELGLRIGSRILTNSGVGDVVFTAGADSEKMRILAGGNIGIGTASPEGKVHIYNGDASVAPDSDADELVVENSGDSGISILSGESSIHTGSLIFGSANDAFGAGLQYSYYNNSLRLMTANTGHKLEFATDNNTTAMTIDSSQNVGIGTASPGDKLHIAGNVRIDGGDVLRWNGQAFIDTIGANDIFIRPNGSTAATITATGNVGIGTTSPNMKLNISHGDQDGLRFNCTSTTGETFIDFGDSGDNDAGSIRYDHNDNSLAFRVNAAGRVRINSSGDLLPEADGTQDLGSLSKRWGVVHSADLDLSNEGSQNDVDGTWGSYVIQEGEEDLFIINRRNGKKYKFMLQEVQD